MVPSRTTWWVVGVWIFILGAYALLPVLLGQGRALTTSGDLIQCFVPLLANAGLLLNAGTPHWRRNVFWMLLAMACTLWLVGQFQWTYYEVFLRHPMPDIYIGDVIFFVHGIPTIAALLLQPHLRHGEFRIRFGYLDFGLLLTWWMFLYAYVVLPWALAAPVSGVYNFNYDLLANIQNMVIVVGLGWLWLKSQTAWRKVYANLFGASAMYMLSSLTINVAIGEHVYRTGSLYDLPLIASFLWLATAGFYAHRNAADLDAPTGTGISPEAAPDSTESVWTTRVAMMAVISLPVFGLYALQFSDDPPEVRNFRLLVTLISALPLSLVLFLRQHLADRDRVRLLAHSENSIENLQRLQAQLVQTEKLVSLGQLAAGAAHEINNPLTAILGFSDLLADDAALPDKSRTVASKIRDQARRTKTLVSNLLSFARQVPPERTVLDLNTVVSNAVQLRAMDLRGSATKINLQLESVLPGVRGDSNQLMQVFFNIIKNATEAMEAAQGGGTLTIKTLRDRAYVVVLFSDTGPGIREPHRVFDPFYTTKPVGKGTGLGLSICFGIVQEHGGRILCYNNQEGGAVFRVELPAILAVAPARELHAGGAAAPTEKPS